MVEFQRGNPDGIPFQVWKDSGTSYIHLDGTLANSDAPIAAIEVQGYTYDALVGTARLENRAAELRDRAQALRERVIRDLWMPDEGYFAMGPWRSALEAEVLEEVPQVAVHRTSAELRNAYARRGDFVLNLEEGVERDRRARARGRGSDGLREIAA